MRFAVAIVSSPSHHDIGGEALNEVAEALHHALLAHGHDSVLTNRFHLDDRRTIVLGANLPVQYGLEPPKSPIFYNRATGEGTVPKLDRDFTRGGHVIGVERHLADRRHAACRHLPDAEISARVAGSLP
ncbi:hypothetical protein [Mycobacterium sp. E796]|uniref:hypothetical protein n=1 Tax=Mycobacterium sp. E796 TaxID=1834151 RepID=UPI000801CC54|nr:hypothetical protein [Mycobacterium sp. E796]OBI53701.1 hypothetical protein A5706_22180 [Mycobacterium sp. E796]